MKEVEPLVSTKEACRQLKVGHNFMTKLKREMGIAHSRKVFVSEIVKHLKTRHLPHRPDHLVGAADMNGGPSWMHDQETASPLTHEH